MAQAFVFDSEMPAPAPGPDDIVELRGLTWADYERLLEIRGDDAVPRLTYLDGVLELMSPALFHESLKSMIGRLLEAWCMERGVDITPYGSWTHKSKDKEAGAEPDECYVFGSNTDDPERCDLAIEVMSKSGSLKKLEIYRRLRIREVWIWKAGRISVHALRDVAYAEIERSEFVPELDLAHLLTFTGVRPMTRAVREYRAALRG